ncbi:RNA 2',3'-cyclic phosphodiesterase [Saccharomonospora sp.]|uniref:RNA 2',3'-cyclic phosphodiesterase n=1 Tax=Saccharomonospora sp. TaxID=33913 RepID=UPI00263884EB|nr:RNA 2',3'-cyclic phosphodiesterase [Saccharomonospora sp.]
MSDPARLFAAVTPSPKVVSALREELDRHLLERGPLRWVETPQWHITLGFYGKDDPDGRVSWLRPRLAGLSAPTVRLVGAGSFSGVLWIGVREHGLTEVAEEIRPEGQTRPFHPHLTLARGRASGAIDAIERWRRRLAEFESPEWTAAEVVLFRSDRVEDGRRAGPRYSVVERFPLDAPG